MSELGLKSQWVSQFLGDAVTNQHAWAAYSSKSEFSQIRTPEFERKESAGRHCLRGLRGPSTPRRPRCCQRLALPVVPHFGLCLPFTRPSPLLWVHVSSVLLLLRTPVVGFRVRLGHPARSCLKILNSVDTHKDPFPK